MTNSASSPIQKISQEQNDVLKREYTPLQVLQGVWYLFYICEPWKDAWVARPQDVRPAPAIVEEAARIWKLADGFRYNAECARCFGDARGLAPWMGGLVAGDDAALEKLARDARQAMDGAAAMVKDESVYASLLCVLDAGREWEVSATGRRHPYEIVTAALVERGLIPAAIAAITDVCDKLLSIASAQPAASGMRASRPDLKP